MGLAGAMAGAVATATLHPLDTLKTLRQANPQTFASTGQALKHVLQKHGPISLYTGVGAAVLGAMPSSALYFGAYESVKLRLAVFANDRWGVADANSGKRVLPPAIRAAVHVVAAASGNAASSLVFVPKEFIKQSLQVQKGAAAKGEIARGAAQIVRTTLQQQGIGGLYRGYWATLSRNVPSAVLRFSLYEELKLHMKPHQLGRTPARFIVAGAVAGALASGITTPFDVIKTQVATGRLDRNLGVAKSLTKIGTEGGVRALYAGVQPRMLLSSLFTAVGFSSFEAMKRLLGVEEVEALQQ